MKHLFTTLLTTILISSGLFSQSVDEITPEKLFPSMTKAIKLGKTPPLYTLQPIEPENTKSAGKSWKRPNQFFSNDINNPAALPQNGDPLVVSSGNASKMAGPEVSIGLNFDGLMDIDGISPPDPTGDIGLNHYVQMVNVGGGARFQIWNKQGQSVYGPAHTNTIWGQVSGGSTIGDPIVQYDHDAQRWLMLEMQSFAENRLIIGMSETADPTGAWDVWSIQVQGFPDYPKLYVWNNAYFITVNEIVQSNVCAGYALDKAAMLSGETDINTYRFTFPNFMAIRYQPATGADWEGGPPPPPGSPGMIFRVYDDAWDGGNDQIQMWQIFVDWNNVSNSFTVGPTKFNVAPFETRVCYGPGLFDCIEQPGTNNRITALENIIMYRAPYRNFGTHESIVFNHVSDVSNQVGDGGDAAVRWYELRKNAGESDWFVHQQGTYAPDPNNRFTGTISMDNQGNIGLGYSTASVLTYPGLRLTGRRQSDPPGEMPVTEYELIAGGKSHVADERWGDYSNMSVDPVDGKTFWFTAQYQPSNAGWGTRIGSFQIRRDSNDISPTLLVSPQNAALLDNVQVTASITNGGILPAQNFNADLYVNGVFLANESISGTILSGENIQHTFQPMITWGNFNEVKEIMIITHWTKDEFNKNDTLRTSVKKLTSFDAATAGFYGTPNLICTSDFDLKFLLRNAAGIPLDSTQIRWKLNQEPWQIRKWYGHLLPGQVDTVIFPLTNLVLPQNLFVANIILPNGQPDQDSTNNKVNRKISTNLNGSYLTVRCSTTLGNLKYELRLSDNTLLTEGIFKPGFSLTDVCTNDGTCYKLITKSTTFAWEGKFEILDLYGNVLATVYSASPLPEFANFCAPIRKSVDAGAFSLIDPVSGPNLTANEAITVEIKNLGTQKIGNIDVSWRMEGGAWQTENKPDSIPSAQSASFTFTNSTADLSTIGQLYNLEIKATVDNDEAPENDTRTIQVRHKATRDIALKSISTNACDDKNYVGIELMAENTGLTTIDSIEVLYIVNGITQTQFIETPGFAPNEQETIFFYASDNIWGNNNLEVRINKVNGLPDDDYPNNNSLSTQYYIDQDKVSVYMSMGLDDKPGETSWTLKTQNGMLVASGGNYTEKYGFVSNYFCLNGDSCYVFTLLDSKGDGMKGYVDLNALSSGNPAIWYFDGSTNGFTNSVEKAFCVFSPCAIDLAISVSDPNNAGMDNGTITVVPTGGTPGYQFSLNGGPYQTSGVFTGLTAGIYTIKCQDEANCIVSKQVTVGTVDTDYPVLDRKVVIHPNPTNGPVWIRIPARYLGEQLQGTVTNSEGKLIREISLTRFDNDFFSNFSLQKNPAGTYFLTIRDAKGMKIAEKRIQKI